MFSPVVTPSMDPVVTSRVSGATLKGPSHAHWPRTRRVQLQIPPSFFSRLHLTCNSSVLTGFYNPVNTWDHPRRIT
jgi:hypothetical protein